MIVDSACIAGLVTEASDYAGGLMIRRVVQPRHDLIGLELGRSGPWECLLIEWSAEFGRLHLSSEMPPPGDTEQRFGSVLRRVIRGARIESIRQIAFDRLIEIELSNCEQLGPQSCRTLIAELMGRHSNLVLVDEERKIVEAGKHVTVRVNRYRQTLPGLAYVPPPDFGRIPPQQADPERMAEEAAAVLDQKLSNWLRSTFHGGSDLFIDEVCCRSDVDGDLPLRDQPSGWEEQVAAVLSGLAEQAGEGGGAWIYYREDDELPDFAYPFELSHLCQRKHESVDSLSLAVEEVQRQIIESQRLRRLRERLMAAVREGRKKAERTLRKRQEVVDDAAEAELDRERGELLMAYQYQVPERAEEVTLPRYEGQGELTIPLNPDLTPVENAQRYFRRYKKSMRLTDLAPKLLAAARHDVEYFDQVETQIQTADDLEELQTIEQELVEGGHLAEPKEHRHRSQHERRGPRTTETSDGYPLLYGKSGHENDEVLRAAQPDDLWFHVKDAAGPHVVLRTDSRPDEVPDSSIEEAAILAAALSSQRRDSKVAVDCTLAKNVNKPRRGHPGLAYYRKARTLVVDLNSSR